MNRTWIRESHKVTKALVVEFVLFVLFASVITIVSVMTTKMTVIPTLVVISNRVRTEN